MPFSGSYPTISACPLLAYTESVSQDPTTVALFSSAPMAGSGIWKRTLEAVLAGAFVSGVAPLVAPVPVALFLSSPLWPSLVEEYQTPLPMIRAIAATAETMMTACAFSFRLGLGLGLGAWGGVG